MEHFACAKMQRYTREIRWGFMKQLLFTKAELGENVEIGPYSIVDEM